MTDRTRGRDQWSPRKRELAQIWTLVPGLGLIMLGSVGGVAVALKEHPALTALVYCGALVLAGMVLVVPKVAVPLAYRIIDKALKDTDSDV